MGSVCQVLQRAQVVQTILLLLRRVKTQPRVNATKALLGLMVVHAPRVLLESTKNPLGMLNVQSARLEKNLMPPPAQNILHALHAKPTFTAWGEMPPVQHAREILLLIWKVKTYLHVNATRATLGPMVACAGRVLLESIRNSVVMLNVQSARPGKNPVPPPAQNILHAFHAKPTITAWGEMPPVQHALKIRFLLCKVKAPPRVNATRATLAPMVAHVRRVLLESTRNSVVMLNVQSARQENSRESSPAQARVPARHVSMTRLVSAEMPRVHHAPTILIRQCKARLCLRAAATKATPGQMVDLASPAPRENTSRNQETTRAQIAAQGPCCRLPVAFLTAIAPFAV
jgi:hypothetical protein